MAKPIKKDATIPPMKPGDEYFQIPGFAGKVMKGKTEGEKAGPTMESIRRAESKDALKQKMARSSNTVANNIKDSQNKVDAARAAREAADAKARIERAGRTNKDGTVRPPGTATNADMLKSMQANASKKKASLAARLKARLSARRTPQQSKYTMPASTPAGLQQQMKDFKDGKTRQLPIPPKSIGRAPFGERGVVPGPLAQLDERTRYLSKDKGGSSKGKGGSSGAAGSWLQWSGAKRGNN